MEDPGQQPYCNAQEPCDTQPPRSPIHGDPRCSTQEPCETVRSKRRRSRMDPRPLVLFNDAARDGGLEKVGPDDPAQRIRFPKPWRGSYSAKRGLVSGAGRKCLVSREWRLKSSLVPWRALRVEGDNQHQSWGQPGMSNSFDSKCFGPVPVSLITGIAVLAWNPRRFFSIKSI